MIGAFQSDAFQFSAFQIVTAARQFLITAVTASGAVVLTGVAALTAGTTAANRPAVIFTSVTREL